MVKVLLDASFAIRLVERPLRSMEQALRSLGKIEFVLLDISVEELKKMSLARPSKKARLAAEALNFASGLEVIRNVTGASVDEVILDFALAHKLPVATLDQRLKIKLRGAGLPVVTFRGDRVVVEGSEFAPKGS